MHELLNNARTFFRGLPWKKIVLVTLAGVIYTSLVFHSGFEAGFRVGTMPFPQDQNKSGVVIKDDRMPLFGFTPPHSTVVGRHGLAGSVTAISSTSITVLAKDSTEHVSTLASSTKILGGKIVVGDDVAIFGEPEESGIAARLVQIINKPAPATNPRSTQ